VEPPFFIPDFFQFSMWGVRPILESDFMAKVTPPTDSQPPSREGGFFLPSGNLTQRRRDAETQS